MVGNDPIPLYYVLLEEERQVIRQLVFLHDRVPLLPGASGSGLSLLASGPGRTAIDVHEGATCRLGAVTRSTHLFLSAKSLVTSD